MDSLIEILQFAGWIALAGALLWSLLHFWQDYGKKPLREVIAKAVEMFTLSAFMILLVGTIICQSINGFFPARDLALSAAIIAIPLASADLAVSDAKFSIRFTLDDVVGLVWIWLFFSISLFVMSYLGPRMVEVFLWSSRAIIGWPPQGGP